MRLGLKVADHVMCSLCHWEASGPDSEKEFYEHLAYTHRRVMVNRVELPKGRAEYEGPRYKKEE